MDFFSEERNAAATGGNCPPDVLSMLDSGVGGILSQPVSQQVPFHLHVKVGHP
jgi:hypothetical protein